ncbi:hypothetical protein PR048_008559 [Dryococelus australis]|uniref:DDE-1 domain-containing protein n=1 Tax=Dryococelus australis TaxID=614101 RepID=A0ABQ9HXF5_9NEOP|nr:hypothetical protein PR048_008559 [Dryococelus australis]
MVSQSMRRNEELNRSVETQPCVSLYLAMERKLGILWILEDLTKAMDSISKDKVSVRCAAITHDIPRRTLRNHLLLGICQKIKAREKLNRFVNDHFEKLKTIMLEIGVMEKLQSIYNIDGKGNRLSLHKAQTVLAKRGARCVYNVASEHGENCTIVACVNEPECAENLPTGSQVFMTAKNSMSSQTFAKWLDHFAKYKTPGPVLLIFDEASSHLDANIVHATEAHEITLHCFPSNITHELQPLNKSVFKSAWVKAVIPSDICSTFRTTGIYPFDPTAIPDEAFAPSVLTFQPYRLAGDSTNNGNEEPHSLQPRYNTATVTFVFLVTCVGRRKQRCAVITKNMIVKPLSLIHCTLEHDSTSEEIDFTDNSEPEKYQTSPSISDILRTSNFNKSTNTKAKGKVVACLFRSSTTGSKEMKVDMKNENVIREKTVTKKKAVMNKNQTETNENIIENIGKNTESKGKKTEVTEKTGLKETRKQKIRTSPQAPSTSRQHPSTSHQEPSTSCKDLSHQSQVHPLRWGNSGKSPGTAT